MLPQTLYPSWILGGLLLRGGEGTRGEGREGRAGKGRKRERGREERGRGGRGQGRPPITIFLEPALNKGQYQII